MCTSLLPHLSTSDSVQFDTGLGFRLSLSLRNALNHYRFGFSVGYLLTLSHCPDYILSGDGMTDEWWTGKDLEGSGSGLIEIQSRNLSGDTEKNLSRHIRFPSWDSNGTPPEYECRALPVTQLVAGFSSRRPRFEPGSAHAGFVVDKVVLGQVFSEYFGFPCQSSFHQLLHNHHHLSSGAGTVGQ
jgi:hypothetical protein